MSELRGIDLAAAMLRFRKCGRTAVLAAVLGLTMAAPAMAQSLFATRGMGLPVAPVDGRTRALGSIGTGLLGLNTSLVNPADIAGFLRRGVAASLQPSSSTTEIDGSRGDLGGARFPMVRLMYPFSSRLTASIGYGGILEQSWAVQIEGRELIGGDSVEVRDVIESLGGLSQLSISLGYMVTPSFALGVSGGLYTGNLDRRLSRSFPDSAAGLNPFATNLRWNYRGPFATVGARLDLAGTARLGASATWNGTLDVEGVAGVARDDETKLPLRLNAGASALLSSLWMVAAGAEWAGSGSSPERVFDGSDALSERRNTWKFGGGLEYAGIATSTRTFPLRLGASWAQLPYYNTGEAPATEWSGALGIGLRLAEDDAGPLAVGDITIERGNRYGLETTDRPGGLTESFWRFTFSLSLFGN
ncbi:MAG: hypothetical protein ACREL7_05570 [Longimicrobiales bacterium]